MTAIAASITVMTGLFATLYQAGLIGSKGQEKEKPTVEASKQSPLQSKTERRSRPDPSSTEEVPSSAQRIKRVDFER